MMQNEQNLPNKAIALLEVQAFTAAVTGLDAMLNENDVDYPLVQYLASNDAKLEKLFECPWLIKTPIVRNGKQATVGYQPAVWAKWE